MKKKIENNTQDMQMEQYEAPSMEVIEMEIEESILKASGGNADFKMETEQPNADVTW